jgi:MYXO-CTERM domain-containing protein
MGIKEGIGIGKAPVTSPRNPWAQGLTLCLTAAGLLFSSGLLAQGMGGPTRKVELVKKYFKPDPDNPKALLPSDHAQNVGLDEGYAEAMTIPAIPEKTIELLEEGKAKNRTQSETPRVYKFGGFSTAGANPYAATVIDGDIVVVEGGTGTVVNTQQGPMFDHNGDGMFTVVNAVLGRLGDEYDFVTVFTTFNDQGVAAYYRPLRNDVEGIGPCDWNAGEIGGCVYDQTGGLRLQGFVFMNSVEYWRSWDYNYDGFVRPNHDPEAAIYATLGQEVAHRWGSSLHFIDPRNDANSKRLLGRDDSHWASWVDTDASVMDGWDWIELDNGDFRVINAMHRFSTLDLYTMGALPVAAAQPFFFIDNATYTRTINQIGVYAGNPVGPQDVLQLPSPELIEDYLGTYIEASGERVDLTIQDVVDSMGNRCPDPDNTQKVFRQAFVLLTRPGQTAAAAAGLADNLEEVAGFWETWWSDNTNHALKLCTSLSEPCLHAEVEFGEASIEELGEKDGIIDLGEDVDILIDIKAKGDMVKNAKLEVKLIGNGAENTEYYGGDSEFELGDIPAGESRQGRLAIEIKPEYACGHSLIVRVSVISDNALTVTEEYRIFPGYREVYASQMENDDDLAGWEINFDGYDQTERGGIEWQRVYLNCSITPRTPERDASPDGDGAFITGVSTELAGDTSLWAPKVKLDGTVDPEVRFAYWLDGGPGDNLQVAVSVDDKKYIRAKTYEESFHGWVLGRVRLSDVLDEIPPKLFVRFIFESQSGTLEGGIDDFRVLDFAGQCTPVGFCACDTTTSVSEAPALNGAPVEGLIALAGLLGLGLLRIGRRRRR